MFNLKKLLSESEYNQIRSKLDCINANLYNNVVLFDDMYWTQMKIKKLLYIIDELQGGFRNEGESSE